MTRESPALLFCSSTDAFFLLCRVVFLSAFERDCAAAGFPPRRLGAPPGFPPSRKSPAVFFLRSAPALTGGSETLPPHSRSCSDGRDIEVFFALAYSHVLDRREIQPTKNVTLFSAQSVGQEGLVANSQATALSAEKRPQGFFRREGTPEGRRALATSPSWPARPQLKERPWLKNTPSNSSRRAGTAAACKQAQRIPVIASYMENQKRKVYRNFTLMSDEAV